MSRDRVLVTMSGSGYACVGWALNLVFGEFWVNAWSVDGLIWLNQLVGRRKPRHFWGFERRERNEGLHEVAYFSDIDGFLFFFVLFFKASSWRSEAKVAAMPPIALITMVLSFCCFLCWRSEDYSHKDTSNWARFSFPILTPLYVSSLWMYFCRHPIDGLIHLLCEHYERTTFYLIRNFWWRNFLYRELLAIKVSIFVNFKGKWCILESCLYKKLKNADVSALFAPFRWAACCIIFCQNITPVFVKRRAKVFQFFRNSSDITHCTLQFLNSTLIFYRRFLKDPFVYCLATLALA